MNAEDRLRAELAAAMASLKTQPPRDTLHFLHGYISGLRSAIEVLASPEEKAPTENAGTS